MTMIGEGKALPEHIGPFLMLLRFKEETPEEIASFLKLLRPRSHNSMTRPKSIQIDHDKPASDVNYLGLHWLPLTCQNKA